MKTNKSKNTKVSLGCGSCFNTVTIVFIVLKLLNIIDWRWVWVLSPTWIPLSISIFLVGVGVIIKYLVTGEV